MTHCELTKMSMRRAAARRLTEIFNIYVRHDVDVSTDKGATMVIAGWAVQQIAVDTLADRPVYCADKPTKAQAAEALEWFVLDVPNNLTLEQADEALWILRALSRPPAIGNNEQSKAA